MHTTSVKPVKPELLAPAGDLEKLKAAIIYGADAVYIGGRNFGLRAKAKNFTENEMADGISFAHSNGAKVYVTANIFAHNSDFEEMPGYFSEIYAMGADALIISDPGVFSLAREIVPDMDIHISTQANNTNYRSVEFWKSMGASRIVLARELSLKEISKICTHVKMSKNDTDNKDFEIEVFVHGAMCISYSGRCLLSNYMSGRDANRGECAQPCRWNYNLENSDSQNFLHEPSRPEQSFPIIEDERGTYILNSKDLCLIQHIPKLVEAGINSFKIEGRMKTPYYVATTVKAYREAIDDFFLSPAKYAAKRDFYLEEVQKNSHRQFTTGFYFNKADSAAQVYETSSYIRDYDFIAIVLGYDDQTGLATIEQRNKFVKGDQVEFFCSDKEEGSNFTQTILEIYNEEGIAVDEAPHPKQILKIQVNRPVKKYDMLRKKIERENNG